MNQIIISHIQTRDENFKWQTFSTVPGLDNLLILTHSQSTNLSGSGTVKIKSQQNENPEVTLNHFGTEQDENSDAYIDDIYDAFTKNHAIMKELDMYWSNYMSDDIQKNI